jgi:hypothetical protein
VSFSPAQPQANQTLARLAAELGLVALDHGRRAQSVDPGHQDQGAIERLGTRQGAQVDVAGEQSVGDVRLDDASEPGVLDQALDTSGSAGFREIPPNRVA